jgi:hypothetical protein
MARYNGTRAFICPWPCYHRCRKNSNIIESRYTPADLKKIVEECTHLEKDKQKQLLKFLQKFEELFDGSLGTWKTDPINLELKRPHC